MDYYSSSTIKLHLKTLIIEVVFVHLGVLGLFFRFNSNRIQLLEEIIFFLF